LGRLADKFESKPRFAAPGSAGQNTDRYVAVARNPVLQVLDRVVAPQQGHHVGPVGTQQRGIRSVSAGPLRARLEVRQAKVRNAGIDRNRNAVPAANGLDDDVVVTVDVSAGDRLGHVSLPLTAWPVRWAPC
jgi:hypothetical protein